MRSRYTYRHNQIGGFAALGDDDTVVKRIRLAAGSPIFNVALIARKAIFIGFHKALWTILDSNITTAIAAVVLMNFASGPVKGFAITLLLGIISTVYTAFYVSRTIFELKVRINNEKLSI